MRSVRRCQVISENDYLVNKSVRDAPWERLPQDNYDEDMTTLRDYVGVVLQSWKLLLFIVVVAGLIGLYIAWTTAPVYETNARIQVEDQPGATLAPALKAVSRLYGGSSSPGLTEIEILTSRSVVQSAVEEFDLDVSATPRYFGGIGAAMARGYGQQERPAEPPFRHLADYLDFDWAKRLWKWVSPWLPDLAHYAWGGEHIKVSWLNLPRDMEGSELVLVAGENGFYRVRGLQAGVLMRGQVGKAVKGEMADGSSVGIYVAELIARPGTEFVLTKWPMQTAVQRLQDSLEVVEAGVSTGILDLTLDAPSPKSAAARLNAIADAYLRQNIARQSAEARNRLNFVTNQLPVLRARVNATEAALRGYQTKHGAVNLSLAARTLLGKLTKVESEISQLNLKRTEMVRIYTQDYPLVESLESKRARLQDEVDRTERDLKKLPHMQSDFLKLSRNANVADNLYLLMLNRAQELKVVEAGVTGYVRIIDHAFSPIVPSGPNRTRIILVALVLGFMCALGLLLLKRALMRTLETPDPIERKLGIPVYATIPYSKHQADLRRPKRKRKARKVEPEVLARSASTDNAVESLRSLRTSLQFALIESNSNVVTITGPTPKLGKTFVTVNLAFLLAGVGKRVLLIDGDMRRGDLHRYLGLPRSPGLSEVITGDCRFDDALHKIEGDKLQFLSTGMLPPNPSELLVNDEFTKVVESASERFDLVLFDTPPILNLTDAAIIAQHSGTTFLVVRGHSTTLHDVEISAKRLQRSDVKLSGVIFNGLKVSKAKYGYGRYGYYAHEYKPNKAKA